MVTILAFSYIKINLKLSNYEDMKLID